MDASRSAVPAGRRAANVRWLVVAAYVLLLLTDAGAAGLAIASNRATTRAGVTVRAKVAYIQDSSNLTDSLLDAETAQRGYLLTGQLSYLDPYRTGVAGEPALLAAVVRGSHGDPALEAEAGRLASLVHAKLTELNATLQLQLHGHAGAALALVRTDLGSRLMTAIRRETAAMSRHSAGLLSAARAKSQAAVTRANRASLVAYVVSALLVALMLVLLRRDSTSEREQHLAGRAQLEAEHVSDEKTGFLSRVSHELRTPLNAIVGFGQLLERDKLEPDQREKLTQILAGGRHLLAIVDDLLDLSGAESGELQVSTEPVQLAEVVEEAESLAMPEEASRATGPRKRATSGAISQELWVRADRQRLRQVLLNVMGNAVKYNRSGGDVAVSAAEAASGEIRIEVTDSGSGISQEDIHRVFTPFERLDAASRGIEGSGLGLALARVLIEAMGGGLGIISRPGVGTTVWIELPASAAPAVLPTAPADRAPNGVGKAPQAALTVLYVEDNSSNVRLVETILATHEEVTLIVAGDGATGVTLARKHRPAVVLLDLHLPDTTGESVLRRLQEHPATAEIPVVIVSADAAPLQVKRLTAAGAAGYLTKPFDVNELLDAIGFHDSPVTAPDTDRLPDTGLLDAPMVTSLHTLAANPKVGPERVAELLCGFRDDANERLTTLRAALGDHDLARVVEEAHNLAGSCGAFGARELRLACCEIQGQAESGREADARTLDATLDDLLSRTWDALELEFELAPEATAS